MEVAEAWKELQDGVAEQHSRLRLVRYCRIRPFPLVVAQREIEVLDPGEALGLH